MFCIMQSGEIDFYHSVRYMSPPKQQDALYHTNKLQFGLIPPG